MRQVSWQTSPGALLALFDAPGAQVYMVDLYTITLSGGAVVRYTNADTAVTVNGATFAAAPAITRGRTKVAIGVAVDSLTVTLAADTSITINSVPLLQFIAGGGLDGGRLVLERAFAASALSAWVGAVMLFQGRIGDPQVDRFSAAVPVKSDSELLNVMVPATIYQPGCSNTLFDSTCGLAKTSYAASATATSASDATRRTFSTGLAQAAGYFDMGWAVGLTGPNAGIGRTIKSFAGGVISSIQPWPIAIAVGNTFTVYPGCDKTQATCSAKFANLLRFRGYPYVPAPETVT